MNSTKLLDFPYYRMSLEFNILSTGIPLADTQTYSTKHIIRMHTHVFGAYNREDIRISGLDSSTIIYKPRGIPLYNGCT